MSKVRKRALQVVAGLAVVVILFGAYSVIAWNNMNRHDRHDLKVAYNAVRLPSYLHAQSEQFEGSTFSEWWNAEPFPEWNINYKVVQSGVTVEQARSDFAKAFQSDSYHTNPANYLNPTVAWNDKVSVAIAFDHNKTNPAQVVNNLYVGISKGVQ